MSLTPAIVLLAASALLLASTSSCWLECKGFAWDRFFQVGKWSLLAYVVIAGMIEYVFLRNHLSGGPLIVLTLSLVVFAVHVPTLVGFTVARYHRARSPRSGPTQLESAVAGQSPRAKRP